jgi:hypothetical protein
MIDDTTTKRRIEDLRHVVKRARSEAQKVSIQLLAASFNPLSKARADLAARRAALVKIAEEAEADIERLRQAQAARTTHIPTPRPSADGRG